MEMIVTCHKCNKLNEISAHGMWKGRGFQLKSMHIFESLHILFLSHTR